MVWLLPTYNRPELAQQALDACAESGMTSLGVLFVDAPAGAYRGIRLPQNWLVHFSQEHLDMAGAMRWCLRMFPNERFYGWLADDLRPRTPGWDKRLEEAAGQWYVADCDDQWMAATPSGRTGNLCGAMCWGGELIRTVGWWALPGVCQAGIDDAWLKIAGQWLRRPVYDVIVEHLQYKNNKRPKDLTDEWVRDGVSYIENDFAVFEMWLITERDKVVERINAAMEAAGCAS